MGILAEKLTMKARSAMNVLDIDSVAVVVNRNKWPKGRNLSDTIKECKEQMPVLSESVDTTVWFGQEHFNLKKAWDCIKKSTRYRVHSWRGIPRNRLNWSICVQWGFLLYIFYPISGS
ncbi:hypothetical protein LIER_03844 [Lithospermum erythrorhizon]|uniref:Uncharacterized protein n=1 Tax=Lithospermum erythrorhizon TaxID=34254 RepID=A0AAV3NUN4_LITER